MPAAAFDLLNEMGHDESNTGGILKLISTSSDCNIEARNICFVINRSPIR